MIEKEFASLVRDIVRTDEFQKMKAQRHHTHGTVYDHSVKVAYLCYRHHKRFGMKTDLGAFVRGALLHDYYLYDRAEKGTYPKYHWTRHPRYALKNALEKYPALSRVERDMIRRHMFPITVTPPVTAAGWILCFYDKIAAVGDRFGKQKSRRTARL